MSNSLPESGWVTLEKLSEVLNISYSGCRMAYKRGKFLYTRQVPAPKARAGKKIEVHISSPYISAEARALFYESQLTPSPSPVRRSPGEVGRGEGQDGGDSSSHKAIPTSPRCKPVPSGNCTAPLSYRDGRESSAHSEPSKHGLWGHHVKSTPRSITKDLSLGGPVTQPPSGNGSSGSSAILSPPLSGQDAGLADPPPAMRLGRELCGAPVRTNNDLSLRGSEATAAISALSEEELELYLYSKAPEYQRSQADKYLPHIKLTEGKPIREVSLYIEHSNLPFSLRSFLRARSRYRRYGIDGLLAGWGKNAGRSKIDPEHLAHFKSLYLKEGAPSVMSCWLQVAGRFFAGHCEGAERPRQPVEQKDIPSPGAFLYQLEKSMPKDAIYLARYGREKWNRKYNSYIERDYSKLLPGECWVSDHAQIDVAVKSGSKACFPWVTVFRDMKSGKWLGWLIHAEGPNSDHIFQAFYWAALEHGIPKYVYIDNGKDYRCRDFAGTKRSHRLRLEEGRARTMLSSLGIEAVFALPYNAQAKTVERDFLKNKEWFSKQMPGYRGGNVQERPEILADEIKSGEILEFDTFCSMFDRFVKEILNKAPSGGKNLNGMCPDELWNRDYPGAIRPTESALMLFCMRTSREVSIRRNGIICPFSHEFYWAEWMVARKGEKVYLRQDPRKMQKAWVFSSANDEFIGTADLAQKMPAIAATDVEKRHVREAMKRKRQQEKIIRDYIDVKQVPAEERLSDMAAGIDLSNLLRGYDSEEDRNPVNSLILLGNTEMDRVVMEEKRAEEQDTCDLSPFFAEDKPKATLYAFEYEKEEAEKAAAEQG